MRFSAFAAFALLSLSAEEPARVYVYAQSQSEANRWLSVFCDGAVVAELKRGTFFAITLPSGRHAFTVKDGVPIVLEASAGQDAFIRLNWNHALNRPPIPVLAQVPQDKARTEMRLLGYISANRIHSDRVAKADPCPAVPLELKHRGPR